MKTREIKMKIIFTLSFLFIAGFMLFAFQAKGQYKHDPEKRAKKQTEWMKTQLSLSDDQASKVADINLTYAQKKKALMEDMHKKMQSLEQSKQKELTGVLTSEQLSQYETKKAEMKTQRKQGHMKGKEDCRKNPGDKK